MSPIVDVSDAEITRAEREVRRWERESVKEISLNSKSTSADLELARAKKALGRLNCLRALGREAAGVQARINIQQMTAGSAHMRADAFESAGRRVEAAAARAEAFAAEAQVVRRTEQLEFVATEIARVRRTKPEQWNG